MIDRYPGCKLPVRWYHKKGVNSSWHKQCSGSWERGYSTAIKFCNTENYHAGYETAGNLYRERERCQRKEVIK